MKKNIFSEEKAELFWNCFPVNPEHTYQFIIKDFFNYRESQYNHDKINYIIFDKVVSRLDCNKPPLKKDVEFSLHIPSETFRIAWKKHLSFSPKNIEKGTCDALDITFSRISKKSINILSCYIIPYQT